MFLDDDEEASSHHRHGRISRNAETIEASVRGWEVIDRLRGMVNVETRSQSLKALYWEMLHWGPEEEQLILLLRCQLTNNLHLKFKIDILTVTRTWDLDTVSAIWSYWKMLHAWLQQKSSSQNCYSVLSWIMVRRKGCCISRGSQKPWMSYVQQKISSLFQYLKKNSGKLREWTWSLCLAKLATQKKKNVCTYIVCVYIFVILIQRTRK